MLSRRPRFRWKHFAIALALALSGHAFLIPRMFLPLLERPERPMEVAFVDDGPVTEIPPPDEKPDRPKDEKARTERDRKRPDEIAKPKPDEKKPPEDKKKELVKKDEPKPEPPKPMPPPPPPPPEQALAHQKMVDQDKFPDEKDNADAKYLAQKNHRAARDTRALDTNLVRDMKGPTSSPVEKSDNKAPDPGMKDRKVAELQKRAGEEKKIVRTQPKAGDQGTAQKSAPGKLSMRGLTPKNVEQKGPEVKPREGVELRDNAPGPMAAAREGNAGERSGAKARGERRPNLVLSANDYDKIVGESVAKAERERAAKAEVSHAEGRWAKLQKKQEAMRSALENFTPDAYVGRESELGTRAHPYAAYIAEMHRSIHKLWAFSFLPSLDSRGALDPYNDMNRWTKVAMVLKDSGELESATVVRPSGYLPFDAAAWDVVQQAAPFPKPPEAIKSYDGKVYIDWVFHRDERQCGTDFVVPHILTGDKHTEVAPDGKSLHAATPPRTF
jgi:TonB family protein